MPSLYDKYVGANPTQITNSQRRRVLRPSLDQAFDGSIFRRMLGGSPATNRLSEAGAYFQRTLTVGARVSNAYADGEFRIMLDAGDVAIKFMMWSATTQATVTELASIVTGPPGVEGGNLQLRINGNTELELTNAAVIADDKYIELAEISTPAAPDTDNARLYVEDNGAGKTRLVIRFPTGAVQVIATEP